MNLYEFRTGIENMSAYSRHVAASPQFGEFGVRQTRQVDHLKIAHHCRTTYVRRHDDRISEVQRRRVSVDGPSGVACYCTNRYGRVAAERRSLIAGYRDHDDRSYG